MREWIVTALLEVISPRGLYERSDVGTRRAEGLPDRPTGPVAGAEPPELIEFREGEVPLAADVRRGQKTGFFLDQRDNRRLLARVASGRSLLNVFAYTGGFTAHARHAGAASSLDIDLSPRALRLGRRIAGGLGRGPHRSLAAEAFACLDHLAGGGPRFGLVVLDPPSLVRKGRDLKHAMGVYTKLNRNGFRLVENGGYLLTSSCSTPGHGRGLLPGRPARRRRGPGRGPHRRPHPSPGRPRRRSGLSRRALPQLGPRPRRQGIGP